MPVLVLLAVLDNQKSIYSNLGLLVSHLVPSHGSLDTLWKFGYCAAGRLDVLLQNKQLLS